MPLGCSSHRIANNTAGKVGGAGAPRSTAGGVCKPASSTPPLSDPDRGVIVDVTLTSPSINLAFS